ncbi:MAG: glutathione S-transferase family protein [Alphaproteobacteria bacterium]|nr:MAG: glutathione S-transferase family protein [Alphaproteobacteria bacterium]
MARTLYHLPLSPFCRKVRVALAEKKLDYEGVIERPWDERPEFLDLNHGGTVPVFVDEDGTVVSESMAIVEYLEEVYPEPSLLPGDAAARAEVRRICQWFDLKFDGEVTTMVLAEKVDKRLMKLGAPDLELVRAGLTNLAYHMDYVSYLSEERKWLAGDDFSLADIAAAAHLSAMDYIGDVPWVHFPAAKDWYVRVKSRPSFRSILADFIPGMPPPRIYADLDF